MPGTYTAATRTISGAVLNTPFVSADVGKGLAFIASNSVYWGRVATFISGTSVTLHAGASLPAINVAITTMILLDLSERHTYQSYLDEIDAKVKDDLSKVTLVDRQKMLRAAVVNYGRDKHMSVMVSVTGNGTDSYLLSTILGAYFIHGFTNIVAIEYPAGNKPREMLEPDDWEIIDDGTIQDGSNVKLRFVDATPGASETIIVETALQLSLPEVGLQNFPDTDENFENITTLAAAYNCLALGAAYAPSKDSTISADVVNYGDKSSKYTSLGRAYLKRYYLSVFGEEEPRTGVQAAFVDVDLDALDSQGQDYLHHSRLFR